MKVRVQVIVDPEDGGPAAVHEVAHLDRERLQIDTLGVQLAEAKTLLQQVQQVMVDEQVRTCLVQQVACPHCGRARRHKDATTIVVRTLFGALHLDSPRWQHCPCQPQPTRTFSPLAAALPERTTPELLYLEGKFSGLTAYGLSAKLLGETLPLGRPLHATAVRLHAQATAERLERELGPEQPMFIDGCQAEWDELPRPDLPLAVGLDGGYVHSAAQRSRRDGWFEVVAGKSVPAEGTPKCFGFVQTYDPKPKRRLFEVLKSQGMQMNQQVTFLTDGGEDVRELPLYLNPQAEHILDWFHLTMRLTVMGQYAKSLPEADAHVRPAVSTSAGRAPGNVDDDEDSGDGDDEWDDDPGFVVTRAGAARELERLKWFLWHGNVFRALQVVDDLRDDLAAAGAEQTKLTTALEEFDGYLHANGAWIPNYGERHRAGETSSSAFVESTVNQVVSKRMVKKQQMRWTPRGAHLLLQIRTRVLNDELADEFRRWYPAFTRPSDGQEVAA